MAMRIAVLCKKDLLVHPVDHWLAGHELALFAAATPASAVGFDSVSVFNGWKANRGVDVAVVAAHRERPFDRIVSTSECDLVRAAELRDLLGVPGMDTATALAYRDKAVMKGLARAAGLATPEFARVATVWDLLDFAEGRDRVVVKPVDGAGALDVVVLTGEELPRWAAARRTAWDSDAGLLVEEYVDAPMVLVDGVMAAGSVLVRMVSRYLGTCHDLVAGLQPLGGVGLDDDDPAAVLATGFVERLIAAMPGPLEPTSFHCELFDVPGAGMVFCEIAARTGGGRINDQARITLGVDLEQWSCLGQAGIGELPRDATEGPAGWVLLPAAGGTLLRMPAACPIPGVLDWRPHVAVGQRVDRARKASALAADALFAADDQSELVPLHNEIVRWMDDTVRWEQS